MPSPEINPSVRATFVDIDSVSWNGVHLFRSSPPCWIITVSEIGTTFRGAGLSPRISIRDEAAKIKQSRRAAVVPPVEGDPLKVRCIERDDIGNGKRRVLAIRTN